MPVGIIVGLYDVQSSQYHAGVLLKDEDRYKCMHYEWDCKLTVDDQYNWAQCVVEPNIPALRKDAVAMMFRRVWDAPTRSQIHYGFGSYKNVFDSTTGKLNSLHNPGLTCSTFIMAVFHACGIDFIDYDSWPEADDRDIRWQLGIISNLHDNERSHQQAVALTTTLPAKRITPTDLMAAAVCADRPCDYKQVSNLSRNVKTIVMSSALDSFFDDCMLGKAKEFSRSTFETHNIVPYEIIQMPQAIHICYKNIFKGVKLSVVFSTNIDSYNVIFYPPTGGRPILFPSDQLNHLLTQVIE